MNGIYLAIYLLTNLFIINLPMEHHFVKPSNLKSHRLGFHYYPDSVHFRFEDLQNWLPDLKAMGVSWLVLQGELKRAIPEDFITGLLQEEIEPIIHLPLSLTNPIVPEQIEPLLEVYAKWGVNYVIFFDRPNSRSAWGDVAWSQKNIVKNFVDQFFPLAECAYRHGLTPVLSPMEPGGPYWDTVFLREALELMNDRDLNGILGHMALSAYGWSWGRPLNWGSGGPERWPLTKPYRVPAGSEDHRGFRIYDWYQSIANCVLQKPCPIILLQTGLMADPYKGKRDSNEVMLNKDNILKINFLLNNENVYDTSHNSEHLEAIPEDILCCNFWLFGSNLENQFSTLNWFFDHQQFSAIVQSFVDHHNEIFSSEGNHEIDEGKTITSEKQSFILKRYLLLPSIESVFQPFQQESVQNYIARYQPSIGFSVEDASKAAVVTIVNQSSFSEAELEILYQRGCLVQNLKNSNSKST